MNNPRHPHHLSLLLSHSLMLSCGPAPARLPPREPRAIPHLGFSLDLDLGRIEAHRKMFEQQRAQMSLDLARRVEATIESDSRDVLVVDPSVNFTGTVREYEALGTKDSSQAVALIVSDQWREGEEDLNQIAAALKGGHFVRFLPSKRPPRSEVRHGDVSPLDLHVQPVETAAPVPWSEERKERRKEHRQDRKKRRRNGRR